MTLLFAEESNRICTVAKDEDLKEDLKYIWQRTLRTAQSCMSATSTDKEDPNGMQFHLPARASKHVHPAVDEL